MLSRLYELSPYCRATRPIPQSEKAQSKTGALPKPAARIFGVRFKGNGVASPEQRKEQHEQDDLGGDEVFVRFVGYFRRHDV